MKKRKIRIGVMIVLIGIFFAVSSYMFNQELDFYLDDEGKSPNYGLIDFNWYVIGVGIFIFFIGIGYTIFNLISDREINKPSNNQEHIHN